MISKIFYFSGLLIMILSAAFSDYIKESFFFFWLLGFIITMIAAYSIANKKYSIKV